MTYDEMSEYILGNKYLGDIQHLDSIDIEMVNRAKHYLNGLLKPIDLSVFNLPNDFYKAFFHCHMNIFIANIKGKFTFFYFCLNLF